MTGALTNELLAAIAEATDEPGLEWLTQSLASMVGGDAVERDLGIFSAIARRTLGEHPLGLDSPPLCAGEAVVPTIGWAAGDAGRAMLLLAAAEAGPEQTPTLVRSIFRHGDEAERAVVVRVLALLPGAPALKPIALEAGQSDSRPLYSALAVDNPYPALHYSTHEFNQFVINTLLTGLPMERIAGLERRGNTQLSKTCEDYIGKRTAAGSTVPVDIWLAVGPHASERREALMRAYLTHPDRRHRYYAAVALARRAEDDPRLRATLCERLESEADTAVVAVLRGISGS